VTCTGFFEAAAGSNTFYLIGSKSAGDLSVYDVQFTEIFMPTSYGAVEPTAAPMAARGSS